MTEPDNLYLGPNHDTSKRPGSHVTLTYDKLLDMLTTAAIIGRNELAIVQTRGDATDAIKRRMRDLLASLTRRETPHVWVCVVDSPGERSMIGTAARTELEALAWLREKFDDTGEVTDDDLIDFVVSQGCEVYLERHDLNGW